MKRTELPKNEEAQREVITKSFDLPALIKEDTTLQTLLEQQGLLFDQIHNEFTGELIDGIQEMKKDEQLYLILKEIFERGRKETHYLDGLIETGIYQALIDGDLAAKYVDGEKVTWQNQEKHTGGNFDKYDGITVKGKPPELSSLMISLIDEGKFPEELLTLYHELIHSQQIGEESKKIDTHFKAAFEPLTQGDIKRSIQKLKKYIPHLKQGKVFPFEMESTELREAQAYRTANYPSESAPASNIVNHIVEAKDAKGNPEYKVQREKLIYAIEIIDIFQALGYTIGDIGKLVQVPSRWDSEQKNYPNIERILEEELQKRNITRYELEKLKAQYRIGQNVERLKMAVIAREEVKKWIAQKKAKTLAEAA